MNLGFSSNIERKDHDHKNKLSEINDRLKKYCESKGFLFIDNGIIGKGDLNESGFHLNRTGSKLFTGNIENMQSRYNYYCSLKKHSTVRMKTCKMFFSYFGTNSIRNVV